MRIKLTKEQTRGTKLKEGQEIEVQLEEMVYDGQTKLKHNAVLDLAMNWDEEPDDYVVHMETIYKGLNITILPELGPNGHYVMWVTSDNETSMLEFLEQYFQGDITPELISELEQDADMNIKRYS